MSLDHDAIFKAYPNVRLIDDDKGAFDKDNNQITLEQSKIDTARSELDTAYDAVKYQRDRAVAYPSIQEQLDLQYWDQVNGTTKWKEAVAKVKTDNPKP
tara:strand:- start:245 stop:541 length:297 start_codon:yes stop_codon:yes gene_type:complete